MRNHNTILRDRYGEIRTGWIVAVLLAGILLFIGGAIWGEYHFANQGCQYICDGNGDENAYRWDAGCWCRDADGLYNPADSRDGRSK